MTNDTHERHRIQRLRHETRRRVVTVSTVTRLTPKMLRVDFASPDLVGFDSASPDDHVKIFVPDPAAPDGRSMRDYTPRRFDGLRGTLTIDFALHDAGPATAWALDAKPGDTLEIGGPRGSAVAPDDFDFYLLIGDETALPSIARRLEELRPHAPVTAIFLLDGPEETPALETMTDARIIHAFRDGARDDAAVLREALAGWRAPAGEGYVWIAAEARAARALRDEIVERRGHPKAWLKAAGYWVKGEAGASHKDVGD